MEEWEVFPRVATATALKAIEQGVARLKLSRDEIYERAKTIIQETRKKFEYLFKTGLIRDIPEEIKKMIEEAKKAHK